MAAREDQLTEGLEETAGAVVEALQRTREDAGEAVGDVAARGEDESG